VIARRKSSARILFFRRKLRNFPRFRAKMYTSEDALDTFVMHGLTVKPHIEAVCQALPFYKKAQKN
jgi:hypothetical protein